jgi:uncharacterized protein (DUF1684 family)
MTLRICAPGSHALRTPSRTPSSGIAPGLTLGSALGLARGLALGTVLSLVPSLAGSPVPAWANSTDAQTPAATTGSQDDELAYRQEIDTWHEGRIERLRKPEGWLTLVGLYRLREGENRFGSSDDNDLVFPANAPTYAGSIFIENGKPRLTVADDVMILHGTGAVGTMNLRVDTQDEVTKLRMGSLQFYVIERGGSLLLRVRDLEHPSLKTFEGIDRYPVSASWRVEARFEPYDPPKVVKVPNVLGMVSEEACPGALVFEMNGKTHRIDPLLSSENHLFIIFGDETNGDVTYGGGRFLYTELPEEGDTVVLDFNKAYNPPCVFTPYATCALPPEQNKLALEVLAGEKNYHGYEH